MQVELRDEEVLAVLDSIGRRLHFSSQKCSEPLRVNLASVQKKLLGGLKQSSRLKFARVDDASAASVAAS